MFTFCFHITNNGRTYTAKVQAGSVREARTTIVAGLRDGEKVQF